MSTSDNFYVTGGSLHADAPSYIERQADAALYDGLQKGEFCYVLTPRQMGKSSLMIRTAARLREEGMQVAVLDLTALGRNLQPEQWYFGLLDRLGEQLGLDQEFEAFWHGHKDLGPMQRWLEAVHRVALSRTADRMVIFVDEIDVVRSLPFSTDELFAGIRECYNRRAHDKEFARLTFCLLGAAAPTDLVQDTQITPFNIGRRIELNDFTAEEAVPLAGGLGGGEGESGRAGDRPTHTSTHPTILASTRLLDRVLYWTGGHPYLTQRLCKAVANASVTIRGSPISRGNVHRLCSDLFLSSKARERDDNLLFVRDRLLKSNGDLAALLELYGRVRRGRRVPDDEADLNIGLLRISGIVNASGGRLRVRNRIYEQVFDLRWVQEHMPGAEIRRQRAAYRLGMLRKAAFAGTIVVVMAILVATSVSFARRAKLNQREADRRTTQANGLTRDLKVALAEKVEALSQKDFALRKVEEAVWAEKAGAEKARKAADLARRERDHARTETARADREARENSNSLVRMTVAGGLRALESDDSTGALLWFVRALQMDRVHPEREAVDRIRIGAILDKTPKLRHCWFGVTYGELSPDGQRVLTTHRDGAARIWDAGSGAPLTLPMAHGKDLARALFSPDGRWALTIGGPVARVWDASTGRSAAPPLRHGGQVKGADWSHDSRRIVTGSADRGLRIWEPSTGSVVTAYVDPVYKEGLSTVRFSPDGKLVAESRHGSAFIWGTDPLRPKLNPIGPIFEATHLSFSPDGRSVAYTALTEHEIGIGIVGVFDSSTGFPITARMEHRGVVNSVNFSPDGRRLVTSSYDQRAQVWAVDTGKPVGPPLEHKGQASNAVYSSDGRFIASTAIDSGSRVWNSQTFEPVSPLLNHGIGTAAISISPNGQRLLVVNGMGISRLWELTRDHSQTLPYHGTCAYFSRDGMRVVVGTTEGAYICDSVTGRDVCPTLAHPGRVNEVAFSPNEKCVATAGEDSVARIWSASTGRLLRTLTHPGPVRTIAFSSDGNRLATTTRRSISVWDLSTGRQIRTLPSDKAQLEGAQFSPDGRHIGIGGADGVLRIQEIESGRTTAVIRHGACITSASFSSDSHIVVTSSQDNAVRIWDAETGLQIRAPIYHAEMVSHACISPNGRQIATACGHSLAAGPREARIWDSVTAKATSPPLMHNRAVRHIGFSPDGRLVVTASADGAVRVWDSATGEPVTPIFKMPGQVYYAEISRGNRHVLAASNDGTVRIWDLPSASGSSEQLMALAELVSSRRMDSGGGLSFLDPASAREASRLIRSFRPSGPALIIAGAP